MSLLHPSPRSLGSRLLLGGSPQESPSPCRRPATNVCVEARASRWPAREGCGILLDMQTQVKGQRLCHEVVARSGKVKFHGKWVHRSQFHTFSSSSEERVGKISVLARQEDIANSSDSEGGEEGDQVTLGTAWPMPRPRRAPEQEEVAKRDEDFVRKILLEIAEEEGLDRIDYEGPKPAEIPPPPSESKSAEAAANKNSKRKVWGAQSGNEATLSTLSSERSMSGEAASTSKAGSMRKAWNARKSKQNTPDQQPRSIQTGGSDWPRRAPVQNSTDSNPDRLRFPWDPRYKASSDELAPEESLVLVDEQTGEQISKTVLRGPASSDEPVLLEESEYEPEEFWDPFRFEGGIQAVRQWQDEKESVKAPEEAGLLDMIVKEASAEKKPKGRYEIDLEYGVDTETGQFVQTVKEGGQAVEQRESIEKLGEAALQEVQKKREEDQWTVRDLEDAKRCVMAFIAAGEGIEEAIVKAGEEGKLNNAVLYVINSRKSATSGGRASPESEAMDLLYRRVQAEIERLKADPALRFLDELLCLDDGSSEAEWLRTCKQRMTETFLRESDIDVFNPPGVPRPLPDGTFGIPEGEDEGILRIEFIREIDDLLEAVELDRQRVAAHAKSSSLPVAARLAMEKKAAVAVQLKKLRHTAALLKL